MTTGPDLTLAFAAAGLVGLALHPLVLRLMTTAAVLDIPSERSSHTAATPRGGGVATVAAVLTGLAFIPSARWLVLPVLVCALIGLAEDVRGVPIPARLSGLLAAGLLLGAGLLHTPAGGASTGRVAIGVAMALWLAAAVNAYNFMDGINGISALYAIVAGAAYAVLGLRYGLVTLTGAGVVIAIAATTFLPYNAVRAKIFLGDVGSYGLGAALGALAVYGFLYGVPAEVALAPLAVYLADTGATLARRMARAQPWWRPHRTHVYQRLTDAGWSHRRVALSVTGMSTVVICLGVLGVGQGWWLRSLVDFFAVSVLATYLASPTLLAARQHVLLPEPEAQLYV